MYESWSKSKGQKSRPQGHGTCQQQERNNSAVDGHINFKLGTVCKINRNGKLLAYKMQKSMENVSKLPKFRTFVRKSGRGIE